VSGAGLYNAETFGRQGIELRFMTPTAAEYPQFGREFVPCLSIIDVMMFNGIERSSKLLHQYSLT
jgi:hypothetical protein